MNEHPFGVGDLVWMDTSIDPRFTTPGWLRVMAVRPAYLSGWVYVDGWLRDEAERHYVTVFARLAMLRYERDA